MSASSSDDMNLRAAVDALREAVAQIAELHDVLVVEFGGHRDTEGAVGAAIRILREQRTEIETLRGTGKVMRVGETIAEFADRVRRDNPTLSKRVVFGRAEA